MLSGERSSSQCHAAQGTTPDSQGFAEEGEPPLRASTPQRHWQQATAFVENIQHGEPEPEPEPEGTDAYTSEEEGHHASAQLHGLQRCASRELPAGWEAHASRGTGETYYLNIVTGGSTWELPYAAVLPTGWRHDRSTQTGEVYFISPNGESTYQLPHAKAHPTDAGAQEPVPMDLSVLRSQLRGSGYSKAEATEVIAAVKGKGKGKKGKGKEKGKGGCHPDAKGKSKGNQGNKGNCARSAVANRRVYG